MKRFKVSGMSCAACSARVERAVKGVSGVKSCGVNLLMGTMSVEGTASDCDIISAVKKAGYEAALSDEKASENANIDNNTLQNSRNFTHKARLISSAALVIILMYFSMGHAMLALPLPSVLSKSPLLISLIQAALSLAVLIINRHFFISGVKGLLRGAPNMNTLVSLGSLASFAYSLALVFLIGEASRSGRCDEAHLYLHDLYFEAAAMIVTLISLGKLLEERARAKTTDAISRLAELAPKRATVIIDGKEVEIDASDMNIGDIFIVRPGEIIPADGEVVFGESAVIEAALTGEGLPSEKVVGSSVLAATQNQNGLLKCRATGVGDGTAISAVMRAVEEAAATKAPIARLADKISAVFVPAVMAISLLTLVIWLLVGESFGYSLARGISVLVISCPCALGLATPVAITVASGVGAKFGILFKKAESLEALGRAKTVILDKTGTVTSGKPTVTDVIATGVDEGELLRLAASAEKGSEHPLGRAVVEYAAQQGTTLAECESFTALAGSGIRAKVGGVTVIGGNLAFTSSLVEISDEARRKYDEFTSLGKTVLFFSDGERLLGMIAVSDTLKADAKEAVHELKSLGLRVIMLTGDNARTARAIAESAGIDEVFSDALPDKKADFVRSVGSGSVMVGDGINDAPALMTAEVGMAIGGTDIAVGSADVILMNESVSSVPRAIRLCRKTLTNIKENLFWAFFYNVLGIPLAAGAFISLLGWQMNPMIGAAAMSISSLIVVSNSLRLGLFDRRAKVNELGALEQKAELNELGTFVQKTEANELGALEQKAEADELGLFDLKSTQNEKENKNADVGKIGEIMEITLKIEGMMCPHCEARVKKCLEEISGVKEAVVSHKEGTAIVTLNEKIDKQILVDAVSAQGYPVVG